MEDKGNNLNYADSQKDKNNKKSFQANTVSPAHEVIRNNFNDDTAKKNGNVTQNARKVDNMKNLMMEKETVNKYDFLKRKL